MKDSIIVRQPWMNDTTYEWAVPSFEKDIESIEEMTESIRKRHIDAATPS